MTRDKTEVGRISQTEAYTQLYVGLKLSVIQVFSLTKKMENYFWLKTKLSGINIVLCTYYLAYNLKCYKFKETEK